MNIDKKMVFIVQIIFIYFPSRFNSIYQNALISIFISSLSNEFRWNRQCQKLLCKKLPCKENAINCNRTDILVIYLHKIADRVRLFLCILNRKDVTLHWIIDKKISEKYFVKVPTSLQITNDIFMLRDFLRNLSLIERHENMMKIC